MGVSDVATNDTDVSWYTVNMSLRYAWGFEAEASKSQAYLKDMLYV